MPVDVVIPVGEALPRAVNCVRSTLTARRRGDRIIVVEHLAGDLESSTLQRLVRSEPDVELVVAPGRDDRDAVGAGLQRRQNELFIVLTPDAVLLPGFFNQLEALFRSDPKIGVVTPLAGNADWTPPEPEADPREPGARPRTPTGSGIHVSDEAPLCIAARSGCCETAGFLDSSVDGIVFRETNLYAHALNAGFRVVCARGLALRRTDSVATERQEPDAAPGDVRNAPPDQPSDPYPSPGPTQQCPRRGDVGGSAHGIRSGPPENERVEALQAEVADLRRLNSSLQRRLRELTGVADELRSLMGEAREHCTQLFESHRWRLGSRVVDLWLALRRRQRPPTAEDHLSRVFELAAKTRAATFAPPSAMPTTTASTFHDLTAAIRTAGGASQLEPLAASERRLNELSQARWSHLEEPLVSVIMPAYNRAHLIEEAIRSVAEQTYRRWELLVCDDGSEDETKERVATFADDRIRFLEGDHAGAAAARNRGLAEARGDLFAYLDTDNVWHPRHLEVFVSQLLEHPGRLSAFAPYVDIIVSEDGSRLKKASPLRFSYEALQQKNFIDLNSFVHRRVLYDHLGGFDEELARQQDWDLVLKYCYLREPLYVDALLCLYRRNRDWDQITDRERGNQSTVERITRKVESYYSQGLPTAIQRDRPSVTVVSWDICRNHFSKAYNVAEALSKERDVQLIGFRFFADPIFAPYQDAEPEFETLYLEGAPFPELFDNMARAAASVRGDVVYAVKPRLPSLGVALLASGHFGCPTIVECNDLETAVSQPGAAAPPGALDVRGLELDQPDLANPHGRSWNRIMESFARRLPFVATHNANLEEHLGTSTFRQRNIKDESSFDPARLDRRAARRHLGFEDRERIVLFGGMARRHKGIFQLAELLSRDVEHRTRIVFVGSRPTPDQDELVKRYGRQVTVFPPRDRNAMAEINLAADFVVIWLDPAVAASHYQMPYKLTDALAMGTPVIANPISDLAELGERGVIELVEYGDLDGLLGAMAELEAHPETAREMTDRGRRLYLREFSYAAARRNLDMLIDETLRRHDLGDAPSQFSELFSRFYAMHRGGEPS